MSGIAGIYHAVYEEEQEQRMLRKMKHRGKGKYYHNNNGNNSVSLGHLSNNGQNEQPVCNEQNTICIVFSGRLFNRAQLKSILKKKRAFSTAKDAELILFLYEETGENFIPYLDGNYAFAIYDQNKGLLLCRDSLGNKPLYINIADNSVYFASEMKALAEVVPDFIEFPIGSYFRSGEGFRKVPSIIRQECADIDEGNIIQGVQFYLDRSVKKMLDSDKPLGIYLSGGLDSSIIACLAAKEIEGLDTFAVGMKGSNDVLHARLCADFLGTNHHEYTYDLDEMLDALPEVIYYLESYDAALVRSSIANYFLARLAGDKIDAALSGEGADELFLGYAYLKGLSSNELEQETHYLLNSLHNTALQRGDRMSMAFGIEAYTPFLDRDFVRFALDIPVSAKLSEKRPEKWILRDAYRGLVPDEIIERKKSKFSEGAGSSKLLAYVAEEAISDDEFAREAITPGGHKIVNKEELMYYRIFREHYPQVSAENAIGHSRSL